MRSGSKKYQKTQSRYKDLKRSSHSNCHRHAHNDDQLDESIGNKLATYAPLRSNNGNVVQNELDKIPNGKEELSPIRASPEKSQHQQDQVPDLVEILKSVSLFIYSISTIVN